jgi:hypothetical protein
VRERLRTFETFWSASELLNVVEFAVSPKVGQAVLACPPALN